MTSSSKIKEALAEVAKKIGALSWTWENEASEHCDSSCTNGYDNDGSTGFEIFQNGLELGEKAGRTKQKIFRVSSDDASYFFLGEDEDAVVEKIKKARK